MYFAAEERRPAEGAFWSAFPENAQKRKRRPFLTVVFQLVEMRRLELLTPSARLTSI